MVAELGLDPRSAPPTTSGVLGSNRRTFRKCGAARGSEPAARQASGSCGLLAPSAPRACAGLSVNHQFGCRRLALSRNHAVTSLWARPSRQRESREPRTGQAVIQSIRAEQKARGTRRGRPGPIICRCSQRSEGREGKEWHGSDPVSSGGHGGLLRALPSRICPLFSSLLRALYAAILRDVA